MVILWRTMKVQSVPSRSMMIMQGDVFQGKKSWHGLC
jgi:hypothetical protein